MRKFFLISFVFFHVASHAQPDSLAKARFVVGVSAPELLHLGINIDLGKLSQLGLAAGVGPSLGQAWPTVNIEHRLYFGRTNAVTSRKTWFFRQGGTYFTARKEGAATLTIGADLKNKHPNRGWTIDLGAFMLFRNRRDYTNQLYPALRFQYYSYFKKRLKN